ncbi:alpha/beta hydrolase [Methylobacterium trifolii]|uniref:alpha/beta hydrolase n=1 Tax=Methylobacterium trifolii TaxID=1003092 RepID=UPI001EE0FAD7|nr:alpha/beta hydrolase [Methylobacterium trifolii]
MSNVATPVLEVFTPQTPNGAAVIVAAVGGYRQIAMGSEAFPAADWLNEQGVAAFVLTYRLPGEASVSGPRAPLQDAQRAIRTVRAEVQRRHLDPKRIGALGFSAGVHSLDLTLFECNRVAQMRFCTTENRKGVLSQMSRKGSGRRKCPRTRK